MRAALEGLAVAEIIASPEREKRRGDAARGACPGLADSDGDFATRLEADLGFHLLLCQLSGNAMLVEAWRYLEGRIRVTIMNCESAEHAVHDGAGPARPDRRRDRARRRGGRDGRSSSSTWRRRRSSTPRRTRRLIAGPSARRRSAPDRGDRAMR